MYHFVLNMASREMTFAKISILKNSFHFHYLYFFLVITAPYTAL